MVSANLRRAFWASSSVARHWPLITSLVLTLLPFLFFWRLFAWREVDRMWLPDGDLTQQYFPLRVIAAREIAAGRLPLWNPHMFAGQPGLADSQMAALYPINFISALMLGWLNRPFTLAVFQLQIVLHYALAALFTFAFAYRLTRSRFAAWVAALTFTFGGYLISYPAQQPAILESAVWLPLVLLLLDWAAEPPARITRTIAGLALAGASMALSILAGHPQTFIYVFYSALAYWIYLTIAHARRRADDGERKVSSILLLSLFVAFVAFAVGIAAVQLLPTLEFTGLSTRAQTGYAFTSSGFAPYEIITLLIPGYFGGSPLYVGLLPLLLVGVALAKRQASIVWFFGLLALVALLLSFGDASFVYSLFYLLAPGFALVRDQERAALLWSFALAMLAALGAASLRHEAGDGLRSSVFAGLLLVLLVLIAFAYIGALASESARVEVNLFPGALRQLVPDFFLVLGAWAFWRARAWLAAGTLALIALQLFSVNGAYNFQKQTSPDYFPATSLTRALSAEQAAQPPSRVSSEGLLPGAHNAGATYGFEDISGNDPLRLQSFADFEAQVNEQHRLELLNVSAVLTKRVLAPEQFVAVASEGDVHLYRFNRAQPRAWLVHTVRVVAPEQTWAALNADDFDPASAVVLNTALPLAPGPAGDDALSIEQRTSGRLGIRTRSGANALLVVSEISYPGWKASVDGQPTALLPADGVLMAVALSGGEHLVILTFDPDLVKIGAVVSVASTLLCAAALLRARSRDRQRASWRGP